MSKKIANTKRSGLSVARVDRNRLDTLYYQLQDLVQESGLGEEYEQFFARPKDVASEKSIDWYTDLPGKTVPFSALPQEEASVALERFKSIVQTLSGYSEKLRQSGERSGADLLKSALNVPDQSYLYLVGDNIVVTCWGFSNAENSLVKDGDLVDSVSRAVREQSVNVEDTLRTIRQKQAGDTVPAAGEAGQDSGSSSPTSPQEAGVPAGQQIPLAQPAAEPRKKGGAGWIVPVVIGAALVLAGAFAVWYFLMHGNNKDPEGFAYLKGSLEVRDALVNENGDPVVLRITFPGSDGKGTGELVSERQICKGPASASRESDGRVRISVDKMTCPNGNDFEPFSMVCQSGTTSCVGLNKDGTVWEIETYKGDLQ